MSCSDGATAPAIGGSRLLPTKGGASTGKTQAEMVGVPFLVGVSCISGGRLVYVSGGCPISGGFGWLRVAS
eukprot:5963165-Prymnesium_polylepis.1